MKIKVIRAYSGEEGTGPDKDVHEGTEHTVTRVRGNQLHANGLVEIISDEAEDSGEVEIVDETGGNKQQQAPENKQAPEPANKARGKRAPQA